MPQTRALAVAIAACMVSGTAAHAQLAAFPGAEGFGASAAGGRGGDVYHVTKLTDYTGSTPLAARQGTLRYGLTSASGPRTIVFDVGGTIPLRYTALEHYLNGIGAVPEPTAAMLVGAGAAVGVPRRRQAR